MTNGSDHDPKPPQKKAGTSVRRVVDPTAWMHADANHPGAAEAGPETAEPAPETEGPADD